jgi:hypothetical protein
MKIEISINNEEKEVTLEKNNSVWEYIEDNLNSYLKIFINENDSIQQIEKSNNITTSNENIILSFKKYKDSLFESESVGLENEEDLELEFRP